MEEGTCSSDNSVLITLEDIQSVNREAPSHTAAQTQRLHTSPNTDTAFQNKGIIWYDVTFLVRKYRQGNT